MGGQDGCWEIATTPITMERFQADGWYKPDLHFERSLCIAGGKKKKGSREIHSGAFAKSDDGGRAQGGRQGRQSKKNRLDSCLCHVAVKWPWHVP